MKVRDFLKLDIDVDVVDDVTEELYIAFTGPVELTEQGEARFAEALDLEIEPNGTVAVVKIGHLKSWNRALQAAEDLFWSLAGECTERNWFNWFRE